MNFIELLKHGVLDRAAFRWSGAGPAVFTLTKHEGMLCIAAVLLVGLFVPVGMAARAGRRGAAVTLIEMIAQFVRDEIVLPNFGDRGRAYVPYFLTVFFFILFCNLLGMVPFGATATGNISVTAALALTTFVMINAAGVREQGLVPYFKNLVPHGLPWWLAPLMFPIEILGLVTKSFALCIRLFANMIAGHIVILAFISLIFLFGTLWVAPVSVAAALGINLLELFVALLQAYIFTLLSAIFIGGAVHPQH